MVNGVIRQINLFLENMGRFGHLLYEIFYWIVKGKLDCKNIIANLHEIGVRSFPIILLTSFATGMVLALQMGLVMLNWFGYPLFVGMSLAFSFAKELAPVLTSIVIAGRVGAAITAELGTMKVTEQIDALYSLGSHPVAYLAVPRFLSCLIMLPLLSIISLLISIIGGLLVAVLVLDIPASIYFSDAFDYMYINDVMHGFIKAFCFAFIVAIVSIYKGFECKSGSEGVGKATTSSVVTSIILILVSDYFLTTLLVALNIGAGGN